MQSLEKDPLYEEARQHVRAARGFYTHALTYVVVIGCLGALNLVTNPGRLWFLWAAFGWGIGLTVHGFNTFAVRSWLGADWEERKIHEYLERKR